MASAITALYRDYVPTFLKEGVGTYNGRIGEARTHTSFDTSFWDWPVYLLQHYPILVGKARIELASLAAIASKAIVFTYFTIYPYKNKYLTGSDWPCQCAIPLQATLYTRYG